MARLTFDVIGTTVSVDIPAGAVPFATEIAAACKDAAIHYAALRNEEERVRKFRNSVSVEL